MRISGPVIALRVVLVFSLIALGACGFSFGVRTFDYATLEDEIHEELTTTFGVLDVTIGEVDCPRQTEELAVGDSFMCRTEVDEELVRVEAIVQDDGTVDFATVDRVFVLQDSAALLADEIAEDVGFAATVDCGQGVAIVAPGSKFYCTATDPDGVPSTVEVVATDDGISWLLLE